MHGYYHSFMQVISFSFQIKMGSHPNKWDRSGVVLENIAYNQYWVKVDGSGRITNRNSRFLRLYTLATTTYVQKSDSVPMNWCHQGHIPCQQPRMFRKQIVSL